MSQIFLKEIFDDAFGAGWDEDVVHGASLNALYDTLTGGAVLHNWLGGKQGGTTDQYFHLTSPQHTIATQAATGSLSGYMTAIAQTFGGVKTFNNRVNSPSHSILTKYIECEVYTSAGVNACLAELGAGGGHVHVPAGTVVCTVPIVFPVNNITLSGAGAATILDASAGQTFHVIDVNGKSYCHIKDMKIVGKTGETGLNNLIYDLNGINLRVSGCILTDADNYAVFLDGANDSVVENNLFESAAYACSGVWTDNLTSAIIFKNIFVKGYIGLVVDSGSTFVAVRENQFHDVLDTSLQLKGAYSDAIGNQIFTSNGHGIYVAYAPHCKIANNTMYECGNTVNDIHLTNSGYCNISNNICYSSAGKSERAINLVVSPGCTIIGNDSEGHDTCGLQIDATSTGCTIGGNTFRDATPVIDAGGLHLYEVYGRFVAGGIADNFEVEADGTIVFHNAARVWDDIQFPINTGKVPAVGFPTREALTPNTSAYAFGVNDYIDLTTNEYSHAYKEGGIAHMHAHVTIKTAQATGANRFVKLQVWVGYADVAAVAWAEVTLSAELTIPTGSGALKLFYLDLGNVDLSGYAIEAQINVRVKRIAATGGTEYADDVYITQVGAHLEKDTVGSRSENVK